MQRGTLLVVIAIVVVSLAGAFAVAWQAMPDDQQLQRDAVEELGIPSAIIDSPIVKPVLDDLTHRIRARAVDDVRHAMLTGLAAGLAIGLVGATLVVNTVRSRSAPSDVNRDS